MGWLIALAVIAGLALLPVGVSALYGEKGARLSLTVGFLHIPLYPGEKKAGEKTAKPAAQQDSRSQEKGGKLTDFVPVAKAVWDFLEEFRRRLKVTKLIAHISLAGSDPCDLAVNYGRLWAAVGNVLPQLERFFVIREKDIRLTPDFTGEETVIYARLDLSISLGRLLTICIYHGFHVLRELWKLSKLRKGGAKL